MTTSIVNPDPSPQVLADAELVEPAETAAIADPDPQPEVMADG